MLLFLVALQSLPVVIEKSKAVSFATQRTQVKLRGDVTMYNFCIVALIIVIHLRLYHYATF